MDIIEIAFQSNKIKEEIKRVSSILLLLQERYKKQLNNIRIINSDIRSSVLNSERIREKISQYNQYIFIAGLDDVRLEVAELLGINGEEYFEMGASILPDLLVHRDKLVVLAKDYYKLDELESRRKTLVNSLDLYTQRIKNTKYKLRSLHQQLESVLRDHSVVEISNLYIDKYFVSIKSIYYVYQRKTNSYFPQIIFRSYHIINGKDELDVKIIELKANGVDKEVKGKRKMKILDLFNQALNNRSRTRDIIQVPD